MMTPRIQVPNAQSPERRVDRIYAPFPRGMENRLVLLQVAKNCRTSVEMIEKFYAIHLKNMLDAAAINVRKARKHRKNSDEE